VIHVVGSRGDVQPFVALGQVLKNKYGHRVRLATHGTFKKFVEENGLEFFEIGGDPAELMAFMVDLFSYQFAGFFLRELRAYRLFQGPG